MLGWGQCCSTGRARSIADRGNGNAASLFDTGRASGAGVAPDCCRPALPGSVVEGDGVAGPADVAGEVSADDGMRATVSGLRAPRSTVRPAGTPMASAMSAGSGAPLPLAGLDVARR